MNLISSLSAERRRWLGLVVVCMAQLMIVLDSTIVNVALPAIQRDLHFSPGNLTWVLDAFLLSLGSCMLVAGRLSDLLGRKRLFETGLVIFTIASALCGIAPSQGFLVAARFLQGIGAAMQSSVILAIIVIEFPEAQDRAKAMSAYMFTAIAGGSVGLLAGGALTEAISWHWIFFINLPIGVVTLALGRPLISRDTGLGLGEGIDWLGSALVTTSLMVAVYAIVQATNHGWGSSQVLGFGGLAAVIMAAFLLLEARMANPIMPLRMLRLRRLTVGSLVRALMVTGMYTVFFLGALYLQHVRHYSAIDTGLAFLPWTLTVAALSLGVTNWLVARFGRMRILVAGLTVMVGGLTVLTDANSTTSYLPTIGIGLFAIGLGTGLAFTPLMTTAMDDVPPAEAGLGSAITSVSQQVGGAFGIAVLSTFATNHTKALAARGVGSANALVGGYHLAFTIAAGVVLVAIGLAVLLLRGSRPSPEVAEPALGPADAELLPAASPSGPGARLGKGPVLRRIVIPVRSDAHVGELPDDH